jgi:hypothetical protein
MAVFLACSRRAIVLRNPALAKVPGLHYLGQQEIAERSQGKEGPKQCGQWVKSNAGPMGEKGSQALRTMMDALVTISGQLAQLSRNGIRFVRMTWMIRVWVKSDSTKSLQDLFRFDPTVSRTSGEIRMADEGVCGPYGIRLGSTGVGKME